MINEPEKRSPDGWVGSQMRGWYLNQILDTDKYDPEALYEITKDKEDTDD